MILQLISILTIVVIPLVALFGWDTFSWGEDINRLCLRGPFNKRLIQFKELYRNEWNSSLINLYAVKFRILRVLQFIIIFISMVYFYNGYKSAKFCVDNNISVSDFALKNSGTPPEHFKYFLGCAATIWVLSIFVKSTTVVMGTTIKHIKNEMTDASS